MIALIGALVAGVLTTLAPCVLPLLPVIVGGSITSDARLSGSRRVVVVAVGLGLAFPNISTGVYGFPKELAAPIAIAAVQGFLAQCVQRVLFVCFDQENHRLYRQALG